MPEIEETHRFHQVLVTIVELRMKTICTAHLLFINLLMSTSGIEVFITCEGQRKAQLLNLPEARKWNKNTMCFP